MSEHSVLPSIDFGQGGLMQTPAIIMNIRNKMSSHVNNVDRRFLKLQQNNNSIEILEIHIDSNAATFHNQHWLTCY